jgi:hypothetical protein
MVGPGKLRLGFTISALSGHAPLIPDTQATLGLCSAVTTCEYFIISCIGSSRVAELGVSPEGAASANGLSDMYMNVSAKELLSLRDGRDACSFYQNVLDDRTHSMSENMYLSPTALESAAVPTNDSRDVLGPEQ